MIREPISIRFINNQTTLSEALESFSRGAKDNFTKECIEEAKNNQPLLEVFKEDFRTAIFDLIDNGASHYFKNYVDNYTKPSLEEFLDEKAISGSGVETRWVCIKDKEAPWIEALFCYNLLMFIKAFGIGSIKKCKQCDKVFTNKGKYASYCSDSCKAIKGGKD